jgi:predicted nucleotidyltransferase
MTNLDAIDQVAMALRELWGGDMVFVGGAVVGLLLTDPAAPAPRYTDDVDVVIGPVSRVAFSQLEARLREAGHTQPIEGPICRWRIHGTNVDLMPADANVLGFSNRWYQAMMGQAVEVSVAAGRLVRIVSPPYLLATKLDAFAGRGAGDFMFSRDIGDIVSLVDGRAELVQEMQEADQEVRDFVGSELRRLLEDARFVESIPGHLMPDTASQSRAALILARLQAIAQHR